MVDYATQRADRSKPDTELIWDFTVLEMTTYWQEKLRLKWVFNLANYNSNLSINAIADRLAQLVERWNTVREVSGSSPRPDQHSGS